MFTLMDIINIIFSDLFQEELGRHMCARKFKISSELGWIIFAVLLSSCATFGFERDPTPTPIQDPGLFDYTLITGEPCLPPCWQGLQVGVTSKEEAVKQIRSLSFIDADSEWEGELYSPLPPDYEEIFLTGVVFDWKQPENEPAVEMRFVDNRLALLSLSPNSTLRFVDVIALLGEPDLVGLDPTGRSLYCTLELVWNKHQLRISDKEWTKEKKRELCRLVKENGNKIPKDLTVDFIDVRSENYFSGSLNYHSPWQGFLDD